MRRKDELNHQATQTGAVEIHGFLNTLLQVTTALFSTFATTRVSIFSSPPVTIVASGYGLYFHPPILSLQQLYAPPLSPTSNRLWRRRSTVTRRAFGTSNFSTVRPKWRRSEKTRISLSGMSLREGFSANSKCREARICCRWKSPRMPSRESRR